MCARFQFIWYKCTACISFQFPETREKNEAFGSSLLLANSPMSPKIVNGSFAAIFDTDEFLAKAYAGIRMAVKLNCRKLELIKTNFLKANVSFTQSQHSPAMRRRVKGILMSGELKSLSVETHIFHCLHSLSVQQLDGAVRCERLKRYSSCGAFHFHRETILT